VSESSSALASTWPAPPPSSRPGPGLGVVRALPRGDSYDRATPRELKAEAIRLFKLCRIGKRELARRVGRSKSAVQYWLDENAKDRTPKAPFVRFLAMQLEAEQLEAERAEQDRAFARRLAEVLGR
jgi:transposase-like protein